MSSGDARVSVSPGRRGEESDFEWGTSVSPDDTIQTPSTRDVKKKPSRRAWRDGGRERLGAGVVGEA